MSLEAFSPPAFIEALSTSLGLENPCSSSKKHSHSLFFFCIEIFLQFFFADVNGDPHFIQTLLDYQTHEPISICYDVSGQSEESIFILKDKLVDVKVEGILLDDYYMHKIKIEIETERLIVDTKLIFYQNKIVRWSENEIFYIKNLRIECLSKEKMTIEIWRNERENLKMMIEKSKNNFGIEHLDVSFSNLNLNENRFGGLLGDVQRKKITVLKRGIKGDKELSIEVDGKEIRGRLEMRKGRECILISTKELIKQKKMFNYVH